MTHPRVLFVTPAAFNRITGGGITFTNLFTGWPKDALACVHSDPVPTTPEVCDRYYSLGPDEIRAWGPLQRLRGGTANNAVDSGGPVGPTGKPSPKTAAPRAVRKFIFGDGLPEIGRLSPRLEDWITKFRPQVLYTILGSNGMMELVDAIRRRFDLPVVVHIMDDWVEAHNRSGLLSGIERGRMIRLVGNAMGTATTRMAICDAMADAYRDRYGSPFSVFQNTIDVAKWRHTAKTDLTPSNPVRLLYTGSILPFAQTRSLVECAEVVKRLNDQGFAVQLDVHAPAFLLDPIRDQLQTCAQVRLLAPITDDDAYFGALAAADLLLLPVNFDDHTIRYIRFSMPTKVPSYLVAGTPVLVYGPAGIAQVEYARRSGWGMVLDAQGLDGLMNAIKVSSTDQELRRRLSQAAQTAAQANHDAAQVRARFQGELVAAANRGTAR